MLFPDFSLEHVAVSAGKLRLRRGGSGPALLLLHGNPQTHAMWHKVAPELAKRRKSLGLYERAVASSVTLRGGVQDHVQQDIATLAEAIAQRRELAEPDESCTLLAAVVLVTYRRAVLRWLAGPATKNPRDIIDDELQLLIAQF